MSGVTETNDNYELSDGKLVINKDMLHDQDLLFDEACQKLLSSKSNDLVIDLSSSSYINSTYVGIIAATFFQANTRKKKLSLRATPNLIDVLRLAGFEEFIPIEEVS